MHTAQVISAPLEYGSYPSTSGLNEVARELNLVAEKHSLEQTVPPHQHKLELYSGDSGCSAEELRLFVKTDVPP